MIDYAFDFEKLEFIKRGKDVEKVEKRAALKQWITKLLMTRTDSIYTEYGMDFYNELTVRKNFESIKNSVKNDLQKKLLKNSEILSVENIVVTADKHTMNIECRINTIYGNMEVVA